VFGWLKKRSASTANRKVDAARMAIGLYLIQEISKSSDNKEKSAGMAAQITNCLFNESINRSVCDKFSISQEQIILFSKQIMNNDSQLAEIIIHGNRIYAVSQWMSGIPKSETLNNKILIEFDSYTRRDIELSDFEGLILNFCKRLNTASQSTIQEML
jgi:hypothetical protein